ncbi:similar to Saccharomyces cerevisiae YOR252W TMA16 Protein of unknown function that associates with ribosomes [Maudiozyma saulgeensis]|uniref:Translation machinery-associated protein 16 n=1 Tax=Maudiozyma saulgeensis TaxID=1789683 RepID=A0A1X7R552_9SACH|nr:similar to Saccharomyces cerevisiae YOR252W TMA16 Protein of unknown function that associates with ribosomes [Kazachstania saulgeensis]
MPVSKTLSKIKKGLAKKGKVTIHPKGRKFQRLTRATLREEKIATRKRAHNERKSNELSRVKYIQNLINLDSFKNKTTFSTEEIAIFINQFIERDDEELNDLIKKRRSNRPPTTKQQMLQSKRDLEMEEFNKGFLCPDLTDIKNVEFLRKWNNSFGSMSTLKLMRIDSDGKQVIGGGLNTSDPVANDIEMS